MRTTLVGVQPLAAVLLLAACSFDLSVPDQPARGGLRGTVDTSAGRLSPGGIVLALVDSRQAKTETTTEPSGAFVFGDLAPGDYFLRVAAPTYQEKLIPFVRVPPGNTLDLGVIRLEVAVEPPANVHGQVNVLGGGDAAGGQVEFLLQPSNTLVRLAPIGAGGVFVQDVPAGTYVLRASHPIYVTVDSMPSSFAAGQTVDLTQSPITLELNPATLTGSIHREVDAAAALPASGALVTVDPGGFTTVSDSTGRFSLGGLAAGPREYRISLAGFTDPSRVHTTTLAPGATTDVGDTLLALDRGIVIGTVELADRQPALDITVSVVGAPYSVPVSPDPVDSFKGSFRLAGLPVGTYDLEARRAGYSRVVIGGVTVTANHTSDVGTLTLTVLQGDFVIDDADATNTNGYTRARDVTLKLDKFVGAARFRASESAQFADAGYAPFTGPSQPFSLSANEGTHTIYAQYQDGSGVESPVFVSKVVLDTVAPASPSLVLNGGEPFTRFQTFEAALDAREQAAPGVDAVSGLSYVRLAEVSTVSSTGLLNGTQVPFQRSVPFTRTSPDDGPQPVFAQYIDHAGNHSAVVGASVVVDTVLPTGSVHIRPGPLTSAGRLTNQLQVQLDETAAAEPDGGFTRIRLANSLSALATAVYEPMSLTRPWPLEGAGGDADREVWGQLQDAALNVSAPFHDTITLDTTGPSPVSFTTSEPDPTRNTSVALSVSASDVNGLAGGDTLTISEDSLFQSSGTVGPRALPATGTLQFPVSTGDGRKQLYARFRDAAGNVTTATLSVNVDATPPTGSMTLEGTLADGTTSPSFTFSSNITVVVTHVGATRYLLGDQTLTTCPDAASYTALPASGRVPHTLPAGTTPHVVKLCLADAAGNTTLLPQQSISLDAVVPSGCTVALSGTKVDASPAPAGRTANPVVSVAVSGCSEVPAQMAFSEQSLPCTSSALQWGAFSASSTWVFTGDGAHSLRGCFRDSARNAVAAAAVSITLDTQPPTDPSVVIDLGAAFVNAAQMSARGGAIANVTGAATGASEWAVDEVAPTAFTAFPSTSPKDVTFAGTGQRTVRAVFRDDVGNTTSVVTDGVVFDNVAPDVSGLTLTLNTGAPDSSFTNSSSASVHVGPSLPAGATSAFLAQVPDSTACSAAPFATAAPAQPALDLAFIVAGGEGSKRVCVAFADAAGNLSVPLTADFTLDTTPPTSPSLTTADTLTNLANGAAFNVTTGGPVFETNFLRYEQATAAAPTWGSASESIATTTFSFTLSSSALVASTANVLKLRAVDKAGNLSGEAQVVITTDVVAPTKPVTSTLGVTNLDSAATIYWSPVSDAVKYHVHYGFSPLAWTGAFAAEGVSPISVQGGQTQLTLNALSNGAVVFAVVQAEDAAGNRSTIPLSPADSLADVAALQPNQSSPSRIAAGTYGAMTDVERIVVVGDVAYAAGFALSCSTGGASPNATQLQALDLSTIRSAVRTGALVVPPSAPSTLWSVSFSDGITQTQCVSGQGLDLIADPPYLYLAAGTSLRIFELTSRTAAPALVTTLTFGAQIQRLAQTGNVLLVGGQTTMTALDLTRLRDHDSATKPGLAAPDLIGTVSLVSDVGSIAVTRGLAVVSRRSGNTTEIFNLADATDLDGLTAWNNTDKVATNNVFDALKTSHPVSGNIFYGVSQNSVVLKSLNAAWGGAVTPFPLVTSVGAPGGNTFTLSGGLAFSVGPSPTLAAAEALQVIDLSNALTLGVPPSSQFYSLNLVGSATHPRSHVTYGPYLLVGTDTGLEVLEVATPRKLRVTARALSGAGSHVVDGAFLYASDGSLLDLQSGPGLVQQSPELVPVASCFWSDLARFGDQTVYSSATAGFPAFAVVNNANALDRDGLTTTAWMGNGRGILAPDGYNLSLTEQVHAVEPYGNDLVAVVQRVDGFYLEVFDATGVRDALPATQLTAASSKGALKISTATLTQPAIDLEVVHGRAFVALDTLTSTGHPTPGLIAVDLRELFDDDATTNTMVPQGTLPMAGARHVEVQGTVAYVTRSTGLEAWNVSEALDDTAATTLSATTPLGSLALSPAEPLALAVYGSYAFVTNTGRVADARIWAVDIANPAAMKVLSAVTEQSGGGCDAKASVSVEGGRLYYSYTGHTGVVELE